jgi:hypothetical protein
MIKLTGQENSQFAFFVSGYQFPEIAEDYDANWLNVEINVSKHQAKWQEQSACFLTWDVIRLIQWLNKINLREELPYKEFVTLDFDIEFDYHGIKEKAHHFRVWFEHGLRPDWAGKNYSGLKKDLFVDVSLTNEEIARMIEILKETAKNFPPRGKLGQKWIEILKQKE